MRTIGEYLDDRIEELDECVRYWNKRWSENPENIFSELTYNRFVARTEEIERLQKYIATDLVDDGTKEFKEILEKVKRETEAK